MEFDTSLVGANHTLTIKAIDKYGYSGKSERVIQVEAGKNLPVIDITSHEVGAVPKIYMDQFFNVRFNISGKNEITAVNLYIDDKLEKILGGGNSFVSAINEKKNLGV